MTTHEEIEQIRDRIETSDQPTEDDRENLLEFSQILGEYRSEWGRERHKSVLKRLIMLSWGGTKYDGDDHHDSSLTASLDDRESAGEIVDWIHATYSNEETNRDMRNALRLFGKIHANDDPNDKGAEPPESINWIPATTPSNYDPLPNPANMWKWEEAKEACDHPGTNARDAAAVALGWDAGPRSGELEDLTLGDISDHDVGMTVQVDGKTGERNVTITSAVPYVRQWLNQHPGTDDSGQPEDSNIPLWSKLKTAEGVSYRTFRDMFGDAASRIGLDKPDDPTQLRKSSASAAASGGMNQATLEKRYGWKRGSDAAGRYIRVFGEDADRELLKARGMEIPDHLNESETKGPKNCKRCGVLINHDAVTCDNCGFIQDRNDAQEAITVDPSKDRQAHVAGQAALGALARSLDQDVDTVINNLIQGLDAGGFEELVAEAGGPPDEG